MDERAQWSQMVIDLENIGMTQVEIAKITGSSQGMISDIKHGRRGKRLGHEIGVQLAALWHVKKPLIDQTRAVES